MSSKGKSCLLDHGETTTVRRKLFCAQFMFQRVTEVLKAGYAHVHGQMRVMGITVELH